LAEPTQDWKLYLAGKKYNNNMNPNYFDTSDANWEFYSGNQWRNIESDELPKPVFNVIKRIISFQIASLTSSKAKLHYEPLLNTDDGEQTIKDANGNPIELTHSDIANAMTENLLDKFKFDFKVKDALLDGANTGDYCAHLYFDMTKMPYMSQFPNIKGEIELELVDGTNVYFVNANNNKAEKQPAIIICGRDLVKNLQDEAKRWKAKQQDIDNITGDKNYNEQFSDNGKLEVEADEYGKALYIIVYRMKYEKQKVKDELGNETEIDMPVIYASKSVENAYIYQDVRTGLRTYPVAWGNWEKQKNTYHGRAMTTGILPNQIFINRMFAMVMYHLMMTAFPKAVYNRDVIAEWDNMIGSAIPVAGLGPEQNIKNIAGYLEPSQMSNQIIQTIEMVMQYTKEALGISDAALGQIDPKNTSAIIAVQKSSAIPLENPKANLYEWIEDIGKILFDMMGTYYGVRPIVVDVQGQKQLIQYDFSQFKDMWLNVRADVGESSY
jgi:hypothetical protein